MPMDKYDAVFGGKGKATEAMRRLQRKKGKKAGKKAFYAIKNYVAKKRGMMMEGH